MRNSESELRGASRRILHHEKLVKEIEAEISSLESKVDEKDLEANAINEEMARLKTSQAEERVAMLTSLDQQIADARNHISEKRRQLDQLKGSKFIGEGKLESVEKEIRDSYTLIDSLKEQKKMVKKGGGEQQKSLWNKLTSSIWGDAESHHRQKVLDEKLKKCRDEWKKLKKDLDQKEKALAEEKGFPSNWPSKKTAIENALPVLQAELESL